GGGGGPAYTPALNLGSGGSAGSAPTGSTAGSAPSSPATPLSQVAPSSLAGAPGLSARGPVPLAQQGQAPAGPAAPSLSKGPSDPLIADTSATTAPAPPAIPDASAVAKDFGLAPLAYVPTVQAQADAGAAPGGTTWDVFSMQLLGANPNPRLVTGQQLFIFSNSATT